MLLSVIIRIHFSDLTFGQPTLSQRTFIVNCQPPVLFMFDNEFKNAYTIVGFNKHFRSLFYTVNAFLCQATCPKRILQFVCHSTCRRPSTNVFWVFSFTVSLLILLCYSIICHCFVHMQILWFQSCELVRCKK